MINQHEWQEFTKLKSGHVYTNLSPYDLHRRGCGQPGFVFAHIHQRIRIRPSHQKIPAESPFGSFQQP